MKIFGFQIGKRKPKPRPPVQVGVWLLFKMYGPFKGISVSDTTIPPSKPAILILDKNWEETKDLIGRSINWDRFRYQWLHDLEQGSGYCRFRYHELKDWLA